jgi:RNA polymerase sigma-70 factor (ECF subfamily)
MTEETDAEDRRLVSRFLARRDEEAFRALYRRHTPFLYRLLLRMSGRADAADEGVQETWVRAASSLGKFEGRSALKTWLAGIAVHWWREEGRRRDRFAEIAPDDDSLPAPPLRAEAERIDLERAIAALAPGYREAIVLHDVEGHTHEEIAGLLGIEAGTSKSQLSRARRALRVRLAGGAHG